MCFPHYCPCHYFKRSVLNRTKSQTCKHVTSLLPSPLFSCCPPHEVAAPSFGPPLTRLVPQILACRISDALKKFDILEVSNEEYIEWMLKQVSFGISCCRMPYCQTGLPFCADAPISTVYFTACVRRMQEDEGRKPAQFYTPRRTPK